MAEAKTKPTDASVEKFLAGVKDEARRADCFTVLKLMKQVTKAQPRMWGPSIVGFGSYHYVYASGHAGDWPLTGFSPRKQDLTLYITPGFQRYTDLMKQLGKYRTGKSCLYLKQLSDVDLKVLKELVVRSVGDMKQMQAAAASKAAAPNRSRAK